MPYAVKLSNDEVIEHIISWMAQYQMNVDYIRDNVEYNKDLIPGSETYAIMDGESTLNNVTFTLMIDVDFFNYWRFPHGENPHHFQIIDRAI